MSKQDSKQLEIQTATDVEDPQRRKLLRKATSLAVYTAPVLFTIATNAFGESTPPGRTPPGKSAPGRSPDNRTMSIEPPPPPPEPG